MSRVRPLYLDGEISLLSSITIKNPTHSTNATVASDYAIPDPQEAWERFDWLVGKILQTPQSVCKDEQIIIHEAASSEHIGHK
jgi:hypothetical protein